MPRSKSNNGCLSISTFIGIFLDISYERFVCDAYDHGAMVVGKISNEYEDERRKYIFRRTVESTCTRSYLLVRFTYLIDGV